MKTIWIFNNQLEAHLAQQKLIEHNISANLVGAKNYTSHLMGGAGEGRYELQVKWADIERALELLPQDESSGELPKIVDEKGAPRSFGRAWVYTACSLTLLPLLFNFYAVREVRQVLNQRSRPRDLVHGIVIIAIQILILIFMYTMLGSLIETIKELLGTN